VARHQLTAAELREANRQFREMIEQSPVGQLIVDPEGRVLFVNTSFATMLGYRADELVGRRWDELICSLWRNGDSTWFSATQLASLANSNTAHQVGAGVGKDGSHVLIEIACASIRYNELPCTLVATIDLTHQAEARAVELASRQRLRDLETQFHRLSRLLSANEIASAIAHELNQPLSAIVNNAQAVQRGMRTGRLSEQEIGEAMHSLAQEAIRAGEIVRNLRRLMCGDTTSFAPTSLRDLIHDVAQLCEPALQAHQIRLAWEVETALPEICLDRVAIQQVLVNLLQNAVDATVTGNPAERLIRLDARAGDDGVVIEVADLGCGLPARRNQLFDAYFTTKAHGIGLGLSICSRIVTSHGGQIWAEDNQPRGAVFRLCLPLTSEPHEARDKVHEDPDDDELGLHRRRRAGDVPLAATAVEI
jgi:two-component system, LuxR family, sensor kinase FixL